MQSIKGYPDGESTLASISYISHLYLCIQSKLNESDSSLGSLFPLLNSLRLGNKVKAIPQITRAENDDDSPLIWNRKVRPLVTSSKERSNKRCKAVPPSCSRCYVVVVSQSGCCGLSPLFLSFLLTYSLSLSPSPPPS